ncbi:CAMKK/CAMKK-META protein kinase [Paracoccidioides lutzii Pb01]|uniref:CAMKK/CAMKK-META protein kinase n=1 Tax=Paracoccidioides lutzii (strain ATCC MYA-826 / Pb01) TaxID=502779 RepID=A0A0A2V3J1_PARBA|nr:CAMKK/CAMKK-META protein kinase [Paracoccidioides lutzii Pb01]KGQ00952.1 CAMKK/CAMKK-META protein kinase [Paracoccidioides lutzii Pb01]
MAQDQALYEHQKSVLRKITTDCSETTVEPCIFRSATPSYSSPLRHYTRSHTAPRRVKETLNARSEYTNSEDDGTAEHRINQYLIKQEIGRGSFGAVHLAVDQYGQEYAVKEFSKSRLRKRAQSHVLRNPRGTRRPGVIAAGLGLNSPLHRHPSSHEDEDGGNPLYLIKEEIAIMKKLHHNNLVALIEVLDDPTEDSLYMVMEMCKKGVIMKVGLGEESDPYDNEHCRCWFRDLILGVEYLHAQNIVHRDIKPDNCLLTNDDVLKIVDFGVSEMFQKDSDMYTAKSAGSPAFLPPELCVAKHGDISGTAADIWSMGVTLYCLRYGRIPFEKESIFELYESIRNDEAQYENETDEDFMDLMSKILEKDPAKRIKMPGLRDHPWVTKRGSDPLLSAEENTGNFIGDLTEEEVNTAITKKIGNVLTVVRAVQKFKRLIEPENAPPMQSILGQDVEPHFVQPPLSMEAPGVEFSSAHTTTQNTPLGARSIHSKTGLTDSRRQIAERSLNINTSMRKSDNVSSLTNNNPEESLQGACQHSLVSTTNSASPPPQISRTNTPSKLSFSEGTRGHARDPLEEEHPFLFIGPSTFTGVLTAEEERISLGYFTTATTLRSSATEPRDISNNSNDVSGAYGFPTTSGIGLVPIVSESPGAADIDIYETAYTEEVERIRKHSLARHAPTPKVYLTRRVEGKESTLGKLLRQAADAGSEQKGDPPVAGVSTTLPVLTPADENTREIAAEVAAVGSVDISSQEQTLEGKGMSVKAGGEAEPAASSERQVEAEQQTQVSPSATRSLFAKSTSATVDMTGSTNAAAATAKPPATQKSRSSLRSILGRVRRESGHFRQKRE